MSDVPPARLQDHMILAWVRAAPQNLPFADAASTELPLARLLRLSLFQVTVGLATVLLTGTLNRVMIVEMAMPAWLVALMVSLPLLFAPFRALVGFRSDTHRSVLGWRRVPYIWLGTMLQWGGLAIMPFALILLSGDTRGPPIVGQAGAALAFLLVGAGLHTTQTAGLALATDLASAESRSRVVALMYVMLLLGTVGSALLFGLLLRDFSQLRLIQVVQGAAVVTMVLNVVALWKQEPRDPTRRSHHLAQPSFRESWRSFLKVPDARRLLTAVGLGTAAFSMQDILLEPFGGEILGMGVAATTVLTALSAGGALAAFAIASRALSSGYNQYRLSAYGLLTGVFAFAAVVFAAPLDSPLLFKIGATLIGFGAGLFSVGTLVAVMGLDVRHGQHTHTGLALGAWGAVQATAAGVSIALGGALRDVFSSLAEQGMLGPALNGPATGYLFVYHIELMMLFAAIIAIGPLVRHAPSRQQQFEGTDLGLAEFPR